MSLKKENLVITPDDFKNKFGIDLSNILRDSDNDSNYPFIFLRMVQDFLIDWCNNHGFVRMRSFSDMSSIQFESFQEAVLYQAYYTWKNGAVGLGLESGFDAERGSAVNGSDIERIEVPNRVISLLHNSGLFNLKMKNRPRFNRGYPGVPGAFTGENY